MSILLVLLLVNPICMPDDLNLGPLWGRVELIYTQDWVLGFNKPAHLNSTPWVQEGSLIETVRRRFWSIHEEIFLGHRLDRDTSWVIVCLTEQHLARRFSKALEYRRGITKTYIAIVLWWAPESWIVDTPLNVTKSGKVVCDDSGKPSTTHFTLENQWVLKDGKSTLTVSQLRVSPITWRKHQIRAHLASIGFPIIGDRVYWRSLLESPNGTPINERIKKSYWLNRQALHAQRLVWEMDASTTHKIHASIPLDMQSIIDDIR